MIKTFDCVQMKHSAGKKISQKLSKMTPAQQLLYWQNRHRELVGLQKQLKERPAHVEKLKKNKY